MIFSYDAIILTTPLIGPLNSALAHPANHVVAFVELQSASITCVVPVFFTIIQVCICYKKMTDENRLFSAILSRYLLQSIVQSSQSLVKGLQPWGI